MTSGGGASRRRAGKRQRRLALALDQVIERPEECREGFTGTGRGDDERVGIGSNGAPGLLLDVGGAGKDILKPAPDGGPELSEDGVSHSFTVARRPTWQGRLIPMTRELTDSRLTNHIAEGVGEILKGVRISGLLRGLELGDAGDVLAQEWISRVLEQHRPDDGFLSEEATDDMSRLKKDRVWIVDPIDGTKEFSTGRQDWAIHIALVINGVPEHAAVGMPDLGVTFKSSDVRAVTGPMSKKFVVSRNRPPQVAGFIAEKMGYETVGVGSAGAKAMHVLLGDFDGYIHAGGQYEWDQAAPVGVARAAGLHCSRLDGSPITFNNEDTFIPDLVICRPEIKDEVLAAAAEFAEANGGYN